MIYASVLNKIFILNKYLAVFIDFMGILSFIFAFSFILLNLFLRKRNNTIIKMGSIVVIFVYLLIFYTEYIRLSLSSMREGRIKVINFSYILSTLFIDKIV